MGVSKKAKKSASDVPEANGIKQMQRFLTKAFPSARIKVDEPLSKGGVWLLDIFLPNYHLAVAWQRAKGFGVVSNEKHAYGEGVHEGFDTLEDALPRIVDLVSNRRPTSPPEAVRLKELREQRGLSQEELARRLSTKQASVSRTEGRSDFLLSTLKKHAEALGARLVVKMVFPDGEMELQLEEAQ